ncbi:hypothetical protein ACLOJK_029577 [Asimina triloba]
MCHDVADMLLVVPTCHAAADVKGGNETSSTEEAVAGGRGGDRRCRHERQWEMGLGWLLRVVSAVLGPTRPRGHDERCGFFDGVCAIDGSAGDDDDGGCCCWDGEGVAIARCGLSDLDKVVDIVVLSGFDPPIGPRREVGRRQPWLLPLTVMVEHHTRCSTSVPHLVHM